jgi:hypothetical protein
MQKPDGFRSRFFDWVRDTNHARWLTIHGNEYDCLSFVSQPV